MEQRPLEYTVKIYCEGFTEWYYFEWLRTNNRFKFSMEPDIPKNSRSSYKQNLKLIDKELRKNPQERADAIFLVIDTDTLVKNKAQYAIYQEAKEKYKKQGVIFIESHPCIEIWFLYHLMDKFARTNFETYEALRPAIESVLPKYEKTARYYQKNSQFRESILKSQTNREKAIDFSIKHVNTSLLKMRLPITQKCSRLYISSVCCKSLQKSDYYWQKSYVPMLLFNQISRAINL